MHPQRPGVDWGIITIRGSNRGILIQINVHDLILSLDDVAHRERVDLQIGEVMSNRKGTRSNVEKEWTKGIAKGGIGPQKERVNERCLTSIQCPKTKTCSVPDNSGDVDVKWGPAKANVTFARNGADARPMTTKGGLVLATAGIMGTWIWALLLLMLLSDTDTCTLFRILVM